MAKRNDAETKKETEEVHIKEMCCIVHTATTANGAHKWVKTCYCPPNNLMSQTFYHQSDDCTYAWRQSNGRWKIKMTCYCGGPFDSNHR